MPAALLWVRTNLRSQWRSAALVVLIAGLCAAVAMAAIAGDRRTTTSFTRFVSDSKGTTIEGEGGVELAVRLVPGSDPSAVRSRVAEITGGFYQEIDSSFRPARIMNFSRVRSVPQTIIGFAALLTMLVLVHSLAMVASRRRHDLSVLRALGLQPNQARRVLWWHGGILAVIAVAIGLPLGVVGGRLLWHAVADSIQSVSSPRAPWATFVAFGAGLFAVSVSAGAVLSRRAVPRSIAPLLRSE